MYAAVGKTLTLRQLCELMITVSSNFAANLLIERLGVENIRRTVTALGADGMQVLRGVEDQKAFDKGLNNTTTARGLMVLLDSSRTGPRSTDCRYGDARDPERQKFNDASPPAFLRAPPSPTRPGVSPHPSRCGDRFRRTSVRAGPAGSRDRGSEEERGADGRTVARRLRRDSALSVGPPARSNCTWCSYQSLVNSVFGSCRRLCSKNSRMRG